MLVYLVEEFKVGWGLFFGGFESVRICFKVVLEVVSGGLVGLGFRVIGLRQVLGLATVASGCFFR